MWARAACRMRREPDGSVLVLVMGQAEALPALERALELAKFVPGSVFGMAARGAAEMVDDEPVAGKDHAGG